LVATLAGSAEDSGSTDGFGTAARFSGPHGIAIDSDGTLYIADSWNNTIRTITSDGMVSTIAGLAGSSGSTDGTGASARFSVPMGVAVDNEHNVYVADFNNATIRKITPAGVVSTLAGAAGNYGSTDGFGSSARFFAPWGIAADGDGTVYLTDFNSSMIRKVSPDGAVTTLGGAPFVAGGVDATGTSARFANPSGIAVDNVGNVYIADTSNNAIRLGTAGLMPGTLTGQVRDATTSAAVNGASIDVYSSAGGIIAHAATDASGFYAIGDLPTGSYFAVARSPGLQTQIYENLNCASDCNATTQGTPIPVTAGSTTRNIDFALARGGTFGGRVSNAATGAGLANVGVSVYATDGSALVASRLTDAFGAYTSGWGLPAGTYFARTFNSSGFVDKVYDDITCLGGICNATTGTPISITPDSTTGNIDFALAPGGRISGTVTTAGSGSPLPFLEVWIYDTRGGKVTAGLTDARGAYLSSSGLPTGTYYARTASSGFIDKVFDDITCHGNNCAVTTGTPISVTAGATTGNINFELTLGGSISGTVTSASTGMPISDLVVQVYSSSGVIMSSANTNGSGVYTVGALPSGAYFVRTSTNPSGFMATLYDNISCTTCSVTMGTPISVTIGTTTGDIDFALLLGGRFTGTVTNAATGAGLANVGVNVFATNGSLPIGYGFTDASGAYTLLLGLPTGTYFARTFTSPGFVDQLYNGITCVGGYCRVTAGTPISITTGSATGNIDFALAPGGRISGMVTTAGSGAPLFGVAVRIYNSSGDFVGTGFSDASGAYSTSSGLPTGTYHARTFNSSGFIEELYDDITCAGGSCSRTAGTPISVTAGSTTGHINFALTPGGSISGTVTSASTGVPISGLNVQVYASSGVFVLSANTDGSGVYTVSGLPAGTYFVRTSNSSGFIATLYNNISCTTCSVTTGMPISVTIGATTGDIDFALVLGGRFAGTVRSAATGAGLANVAVSVFVTNGSLPIASGFTDASGAYTSLWGLPTGTYFANTSNSSGFIDKLYDNIACPGGNCRVTTGTPILITAGMTTEKIDFALTSGGRMSGRVTNASSGAPLVGVLVWIYNSSGDVVTAGLTDASGAYATSSGLSTGTYYARTSNSSGFIEKLYDDITCTGSRCAVITGTPISVTAGETTGNVNFALTPGDTTAPTITIVTPAPGATYVIDEAVLTDYRCDDAGGVTSCAGTVANGAWIDTATAGPHTFTVTALNAAGIRATESVTYTVVELPAITITSPTGAIYERGSQLIATYACEHTVTCTGDVSSGTALDTSVPGIKSFTVMATDALGNETKETVTYTVTLGACVLPLDGLVAWLPGDGTADELVAGALASWTGIGAYAPGIAAEAFAFANGSSLSLPLQQTGSFTVQGWVRTLIRLQPESTGIMSTSEPGHPVGASLQIELDGLGNYRLSVGNNDLSWLIGPATGAFQHLAVTVDATALTIGVYLDGQLVQSDVWPEASNLGIQTLSLGIDRDGLAPFTGQMDEMQVFNRALTPNEVLQTYLAGPLGLCKNQAPVAVASASPNPAEATASTGATVTLDGTGSSDPDSDALTDTWQEGSTTLGTGNTLPVLLSIGAHEITLTVEDGYHHTASTAVTVVVRDTTAPTIDPHADVLVEATSPDGAMAPYTPSPTHDAVSGDGVASCSPVSGMLLSLGHHPVTCSATDGAGHAAIPSSFDLLVRDTTAPTIDPHADVLVEATSPAGAVASYTPSATHDAVSGDGVASCVPVSGTLLSLGHHPVTCSANDGAGHAAIPSSFDLLVGDTTAPLVLMTSPLPDAMPTGATMDVQLQASDIVGVTTVTVNGMAATRTSGTPQSGTWRATVPITLPVPAGGALHFDAAVSDAGGNSGTGSRIADTDGIPAAMDRRRLDGVEQSGQFSNDFNNDVTAGTLTRNAWTMKLSNAPTTPSVPTMIAGVRTTVSGAGTIAKIAACVGAAKEVRLDVLGETVDIACKATTGTITVKAVSAVPSTPSAAGIIELREQLATGAWQQFNLKTGQAMTVGSPARASRGNTEVIEAQLITVDAGGTEHVVGTYQLTPDASVDVSVTGDGLSRERFQVSVLRGQVAITLGGARRLMGVGQRATLPITYRRPGAGNDQAHRP
jgi:hypothetical protein